MDELIDLVVQRTGIPRDSAEKAVRVVLDFIDDRLPEPFAGQVDKLLEGGDLGDLLGGLGDLDDLAGGLGGLLGGK